MQKTSKKYSALNDFTLIWRKGLDKLKSEKIGLKKLLFSLVSHLAGTSFKKLSSFFSKHS
jgi:hypothetical protein